MRGVGCRSPTWSTLNDKTRNILTNFRCFIGKQQDTKVQESAKNKKNESASKNTAATNRSLDEDTIMQNRAKLFAKMNKKPKSSAVEQ